MKTKMTLKEVLDILKQRAMAYLDTLNDYEKRELAKNYKKKTKLTNGIGFAVFLLFFCAFVTLANLLPELYSVEIAFVIPFAILGVFFLGLAVYTKVQMSKIDKMSDDEAMLNGAIKYIQKNMSNAEIIAFVTGGVGTALVSEPVDTQATNRVIDSGSVAPETAVNEQISGKEAEGEGDKLEGELVRQRLSIDGKSAAEILGELKSLYESGLITEADYENKKAEILKKM